MTDTNLKLTHLRYVVYKDQNNTKKVVFWTAPLNHPTFANGNSISPQQITSLGYIGFNRGNWLIYEHYQLDDTGYINERNEKKYIWSEFSKFPERNNKKLQSELESTYQQEKHLLLFATKRIAKKTFKKIKKVFEKSREA